MSKFKDDDDDEKRQEKILDQLKKYGRIPTPPPGKFHKEPRNERKNERDRLRGIANEYNELHNEEGFEDADSIDE